MKIVVTGATGFIGKALVRALLARGDEIVALSRNAQRAREVLGPQVTSRAWSPPQFGPWAEALDRADAVVNLAGEPIEAKRWTALQKARIQSSRIDATTAVVGAIARAEVRPRVLINGSAIGYYGPRGPEPLTESSPAGSDFLARLVESWEAAARPVEEHGVRLVLLRTGVVLGRGGGALPLLVLPFRFFTGGTVGRPNQWISWIHLEDEIGAMLFAIDTDTIRGPVNATAPEPVTMDLFSRQIGEILHRPAWLPMISVGIKLGLGERGEAVMASQRVLPEVLQKAGYRFRYTNSAEALQSLLAGSHLSLSAAKNVLTTWRSHGMLDALSAVAFEEKE